MKQPQANTIFALFMLAGCTALYASGPAASGSLPAKFLERPEGRIAYDDSGGQGPLVIAAPGLGDLRDEYRYLRPFLVAAGYRVVTLDIRGHGESTVRWSDYSAHALGQDVLALAERLATGPAIVIGESFAAGAALWAAHDGPSQIRGVVVIGPGLRDQPQPFYVNAALSIGFAGPWNVAFWTWYWDSLFPTKKPADHKAYRKALAANLSEPGRMRALEAMVNLSKADTAAILRKVRKPALIVMGTRDKDFGDPAAEAKFLAAEMGAEVMLVEGAGHYPHVEMPETAGPGILAFIQKLP